jgi:hypothetical protein
MIVWKSDGQRRAGRLLAMGHSSPMISLNVYGHMFDNTDDRAAQIMEAAFSLRTECEPLRTRSVSGRWQK